MCASAALSGPRWHHGTAIPSHIRATARWRDPRHCFWNIDVSWI